VATGGRNHQRRKSLLCRSLLFSENPRSRSREHSHQIIRCKTWKWSNFTKHAVNCKQPKQFRLQWNKLCYKQHINLSAIIHNGMQKNENITVSSCATLRFAGFFDSITHVRRRWRCWERGGKILGTSGLVWGQQSTSRSACFTWGKQPVLPCGQ